MDSSQKVEITTGPRGGMVLVVGRHRYHVSQRKGNVIYWRCANKISGCNVRAVTKNDALISETSSKHVCDETSKENSTQEVPLVGSSITSISDSSSIIVSPKGKNTLMIENQSYRCQARRGMTAFWGCLEMGCTARAITENGRLIKAYGVHVNHSTSSENNQNSSEKISENIEDIARQGSPEVIEIDTSKDSVEAIEEDAREEEKEKQTAQASEVSTDPRISYEKSRHGCQVLLLDDFKYHRTHRTVKGRGYWVCAYKTCRARAVTVDGQLLSTSGVHVCKPNKEERSSLECEANDSTNVANVTAEDQGSPQQPHQNLDTSKEEKHTDPPCTSSPNLDEPVKPSATKNQIYKRKIRTGVYKDTTIAYTKEVRGRILLLINNKRYKRTHHEKETNREYWQCMSPGCLGKALTLKRRLKKLYGIHDCGNNEKAPISQPENEQALSNLSTLSEEKPLDESVEIEYENADIYILPDEVMPARESVANKTEPKSNTYIMINGRKYFHRRCSSQLGKVYWRCVQPNCKAGAITLYCRLRKTIGEHVCGPPRKREEILETQLSAANSYTPTLLFSVGSRRTSLFIDKKCYIRTHQIRRSDTMYWQCDQKDCNAKVVTVNARLKKMYGAHVCEGTESKGKRIKKKKAHESISSVDEEVFSQLQYSNSSKENIAIETSQIAKRKKTLRQKNILEAFSHQNALRNAKDGNKTESTSQQSEVPSLSARKKKLVSSALSGTSGCKKKCMKNCVQYSYTNLEEVKRMPHLQPRVMVAKFLTVTIEKLSERAKMAHDLAVEADRMHTVNTFTIAKLSLND